MAENNGGSKLESRKTVSVGCRMPNGLVLRLFKPEKKSESILGGGMRDFTQFEPNLEAGTVTLKGYSVPYGMQTREVVGGFGLTHDVSFDFIQEWMKQNKDTDLVQKGLVFISANETEAAAEAKDNADIWDGLGPLKMGGAKNDPRVPRQIATMTKGAGDDGGAPPVSRAA